MNVSHQQAVSKIADWVECRRAKANGCGASMFFLEMELQSSEPLMYAWSAEARAERLKWVRDVFALLKLRLEQRAWGLAHQSLSPRANEGLSVVAEFMEAAMNEHLGGDRIRIEDAYDRFAAGLLRQECGNLEGPLRHAVACDADSAAIFFFAELAYAFIETGGELARRWTPLLNCLIRAQAIYLARWSHHDPQCFEKYRGAIPPLTAVPPAILRLYKWIGDDCEKLETAFRCNLARVMLDRSSMA